jgi:hypothetical protein
MCEECKNYEKKEEKKSEILSKKDCYKNECDGCSCKACADFADCDNKKCYSCKFHNGYFTYPYGSPYQSGQSQTSGSWQVYGYDGRGNNVL